MYIETTPQVIPLVVVYIRFVDIFMRSKISIMRVEMLKLQRSPSG